MKGNLLDKALIKATQGNRNETGLWLACQLRDNGYTETEAESIILGYARKVRDNGSEPYTETEAIATLKSAFSKPTRLKTREVGLINGNGCYSVTPPGIQNQNAVISPTVQPVTGVTLEQLAEAKHLPEDFLKSLGLSDFKYNGRSSVKIPYYAEDGAEQAVRFRLALKASNGVPRFIWRKGDHVLPYGLSRLSEIRKSGWVIIVEGESDCWACWLHGLPALGAPGKGVWPVSWAEYIEGLKVYVWQEPDAQDFTLRVLETAPNLHYIIAPDGIKDISEAYIQGIDIPCWLEKLKSEAKSGDVLKKSITNTQIAGAYKAARHVIESDDPLELVAREIQARGYGGDLKPVKITYLSATTRLLEMRIGSMPNHLLLLGPSSTGKNYTLDLVRMSLPDSAYCVIKAGSPRVLIYGDMELQHKVLIFSEADSLPAGEDNPAASAIRNLLQDHHLHYEVTVRDPVTGNYGVRKIAKKGPTTLITTSTTSLGWQFMTRLFTLEIANNSEQIGKRLLTQAAIETDGVMAPDSRLIAFQQYLQLKAPIRVIVPFAKELAAAMAKMAAAPRILRDFARLISLIKASAVICGYHRQTDNQGRIIATIADYNTVRELVNDMYIDSSTGATIEVRKFVEAVEELDKIRAAGDRITVTKLAASLKINKMDASRRAKKALKEDWIINRELRPNHAFDLAPGEPMPKTDGLPTLEEMSLNTVTDHNTTPVTNISFEKPNCNAVTIDNDDETSPLATANDYAAILGMPVEEAIELWKSQGAPMIHLGPGENCLDLKELLYDSDVKHEYLEAIKEWLDLKRAAS